MNKILILLILFIISACSTKYTIPIKKDKNALHEIAETPFIKDKGHNLHQRITVLQNKVG